LLAIVALLYLKYEGPRNIILGHLSLVHTKYISEHRNILLQADMENNEDIREMEREILEGVQHVMNEVVYNCNLPKILLILLLKFI